MKGSRSLPRSVLSSGDAESPDESCSDDGSSEVFCRDALPSDGSAAEGPDPYVSGSKGEEDVTRLLSRMPIPIVHGRIGRLSTLVCRSLAFPKSACHGIGARIPHDHGFGAVRMSMAGAESTPVTITAARSTHCTMLLTWCAQADVDAVNWFLADVLATGNYLPDGCTWKQFAKLLLSPLAYGCDIAVSRFHKYYIKGGRCGARDLYELTLEDGLYLVSAYNRLFTGNVMCFV
ncbi:unnamed protein product [Phytophthora fragariaefolia]|uniref:Unnamed protein product n=1 Tax=Phytophthora fragariaefolia TaxID=1490495 RepID=A0A9W6XSP1_9STRA|nr:unnamed protein product [Phytophthora fragariaefolia]